MRETIRLKDVRLEDFCNYKVPSMFLITCFCDWKCCKEQDLDISICQNSPLVSSPIKEFKIGSLYNFYINADIPKAIIFGGLEPLQQADEVLSFIKYFRDKGCSDDMVIYTGYTEEEVTRDYPEFLKINNIVLKFGRFVPNQKEHFDEVLGINLASNNQYAKKF